MAKIYGLNGVLRGKQGNNVFSVQNGTQVVKAYQPVVSNPRTTRQQFQRAKLALAGKMSGVTPYAALQGLSGESKRDKRATFVANIVRHSTVTSSGGVLTASINYDDVIYSVGSVPQHSSTPSFTARWGSGAISINTITVTVSSGTLPSYAPSNYSELFVIAMYDANNFSLDAVRVFERPASSDSYDFRVGDQRAVIFVGYVIPFIRTSRTSLPVLSDLGGTETDATVSSSQTSVISGAEWGRSIRFQTTALQPSSRDGGDDEPPVEEKSTRKK